MKYSGLYYNNILTELINRISSKYPNWDMNEEEPLYQILSAFAYAHHQSNALLDLVAREALFKTAKLPSSIISHLSLLGMEPTQTTAASAELLGLLVNKITTTTTMVPLGAKFSTKRDEDTLSIQFSSKAAYTLDDSVNGYFLTYEDGVGWTDYSAELNSDLGNVTFWTTVHERDAVYMGHPKLKFNSHVRTIISEYVDYHILWEYYNTNLDETQPDSVSFVGGQLRFVVNDLLGNPVFGKGADIRIKCLLTGRYEDVVAEEDAGDTIAFTTTLGQTTSSEEARDYIVGAIWKYMPTRYPDILGDDWEWDVADMPYWGKTPTDHGIYETISEQLYAIRFRAIQVGGAPSSEVCNKIQLFEKNIYYPFTVYQGQSRRDEWISDGSADQTYTTSYAPIEEGSLSVYVDDELWSEVDTFYASQATDKHYTLEFNDDGNGIVEFGDDTYGKIPQDTKTIAFVYRTMVDGEDGNVAANAITEQGGNTPKLDSVTNPLAATGYAVRDTSRTDIERMKIEKIEEWKTLQRIVTPNDAEAIIKTFTRDGMPTVKRANVIEEHFGVKTIGIIICGENGEQYDSDELEYLETEINKYMLANTMAYVLNYSKAIIESPYVFNITATVHGTTDSAMVEAALREKYHPLAETVVDGVTTYIWNWGGTISIPNIMSTIIQAHTSIYDVEVTVPATDITYDNTQLPFVNTISLTCEL